MKTQANNQRKLKLRFQNLASHHDMLQLKLEHLVGLKPQNPRLQLHVPHPPRRTYDLGRRFKSKFMNDENESIPVPSSRESSLVPPPLKYNESHVSRNCEDTNREALEMQCPFERGSHIEEVEK